MPGFVTETRPISQLDTSYENAVDYYGDISYESRPGRIYQCYQRTTSFRSRGVVSESDEMELWTSVTRNGLTTTDPVYDRGHEFSTTRTSIKLSHPHFTGGKAFRELQPSLAGYRGPILITSVFQGGDTIVFPAERRLTQAEIRTLGARAISASAPTAPSAGLATAMGELVNDGLPRLPGLQFLDNLGKNPVAKSKKTYRSVGAGEFLNLTFGIAPLVADIQKMIRSLQSATKQARQLKRDSGKQVRRTFRFPEERTIVHGTVVPYVGSGTVLYNVTNGLTRPVNPSQYDSQEVSLSTLQTRNVYFKGAFTYYFADDKSVWGRIEGYEQILNKLLGTRLNAEVAWNLLPWSWLADWFADLGTIFSNASRLSEDGLVLRYGYLMSHTVTEEHHTALNIEFNNGAHGPFTTILRRESKERVKALPFGFGISVEEFTPRQWAILTALGVTKGDRRLR